MNTFVVEMDQLDGKLIQSASCWLLFIFAAVQIVMYTLFIKTFSSKNTRSGLNRMPSVDFSHIPRGRRKSNLIFAESLPQWEILHRVCDILNGNHFTWKRGKPICSPSTLMLNFVGGPKSCHYLFAVVGLQMYTRCKIN